MRPASIHHSSNRNHPKAPSTTHRIMRIFLPMFILFWVFLFTYGKEAVENNKLRGSATVTTEKNLLSKLKENTRNNNNNNYNKNDRDNTNDKNKRLKEDIAQLETKEKRRKIVIPTHAVIVAGHAVVRLNKMSSADRADSSWYLLPYQLGQGFPSIITSHIKKGRHRNNGKYGCECVDRVVCLIVYAFTDSLSPSKMYRCIYVYVNVHINFYIEIAKANAD